MKVYSLQKSSFDSGTTELVMSSIEKIKSHPKWKEMNFVWNSDDNLSIYEWDITTGKSSLIENYFISYYDINYFKLLIDRIYYYLFSIGLNIKNIKYDVYHQIISLNADNEHFLFDDKLNRKVLMYLTHNEFIVINGKIYNGFCDNKNEFFDQDKIFAQRLEINKNINKINFVHCKIKKSIKKNKYMDEKIERIRAAEWKIDNRNKGD